MYNIIDILNKIESITGRQPEVEYSSLVEMYYIARQNKDRAKMLYSYHSLIKILDELNETR